VTVDDTTDIAATTRILGETLELERAATQRYAEHQSWVTDPRLCAYWQGLRRNESEHHATIIAELERLDAASDWSSPLGEGSSGDDRAGGGVAAGGVAQPDAGDPRGFARALATLRSDVEFERAAVKKYAQFARALDDPRLKALMREFVRAETGHGRGLQRTTERVAAADYPVVIFCPTCGWQLDLGATPAEGATVRCPMCAMTFALAVRDGQFVLDRV
jgi:rubrerythrin